MTGAPRTPGRRQWSIPGRILAVALVAVALASAQVPYDRLVKADSDPGNWLMYSRTYDSQRFSPLDQINTKNVANLQPVWIYQIEGSGQIENTPLVPPRSVPCGEN